MKDKREGFGLCKLQVIVISLFCCLSPALAQTGLSDDELDELTARIHSHQAAFPDQPHYYFEMETFAGKVSATWVEIVNIGRGPDSLRTVHDDFYIAAIGYWGGARVALHRAKRFAALGDAQAASYALEDYRQQLEQMLLSSKGAYHAFEGEMERAQEIAQQVHDTSKFAAQVVAKMISPAAVSAVDGLYSATEFLIDSTEVDVDYATRQLLTKTAVKIMFQHGAIDELGGRSLAESIDDTANGLVGAKGLYNVFDSVIASQETKSQLMRTIAAMSSTALQNLTEDQINEVVSAILKQNVDLFPIEFEPGHVRQNVSAPYYQGAISVPDAVFAMRTKTGKARWSALRGLVDKLGKNLVSVDAVALAGSKEESYYARNIDVIRDHLPNPMGAQDVAVIVKGTSGRVRYSLLRTLVPRMPERLSVDELSLVIGPSSDPYYQRMWSGFAKTWPERILVRQAIDILGDTRRNDRRTLANKLRHLITDTVKVEDLVALAGDPEDSAYYPCAMAFVKMLEKRITIQELKSLLEPLDGSQRRNLERELTPRVQSF